MVFLTDWFFEKSRRLASSLGSYSPKYTLNYHIWTVDATKDQHHTETATLYSFTLTHTIIQWRCMQQVPTEKTECWYMSVGYSELLRWQTETHPSTREANFLYWNSERLLKNQAPNTLKSYSANISLNSTPYIINYKISTGDNKK